MILQFLLVPIVLKLSGQEVLGVYSFLLQIIGWAALSDLGFGVSTTRNLSQSHGIKDNHQEFTKVFTTGRTFFLFSNGLFSLVVFIIGFNIESFITMSSNLIIVTKISMYILALWIVIRTPISLYGEGLIASQNIAAFNIINIITSILRLFLSLLFILLKMGLIGLILAYIISELVTLSLQKKKYYKLFPNDKILWGIPDKNLFKHMFGFGLTFMIMSIASKLSSSSDSIILGNILGATAVSIYYVSQMPGTVLYQLIWKITDNSAPALNELYFQENKIQFNVAYLKIFRYSLLLTAPLGIGLITFNKKFIIIWAGIDHYAGTIFTIALTFYAFTQVFIHLNAIVFVAMGNIKAMSIVTIILSITKVVMSYFFINKLGIKGLMIINAILDLPILFILQYMAIKKMQISILNFIINVINPVFKSNIMLIILSFMILSFTINTSIFSLAFEIVFFILVSITSIFIFGINQAERKQLTSMTSIIIYSKN